MRIIQSKLLSNCRVVHGFSTQEAGDLGLSSREHRDTVLASRDEYFKRLGLSIDKAIFCNQIHGRDVLEAAVAEVGGVSCDGLFTSRLGVSLNILTADCIAVLFYDFKLHVAACCHAGWQGSAQGIVDVCVQKLIDAYGSRPEDILVALGPGASWCCYEVSLEVKDALGKDGEDVWWRRGQRGKPLVDLRRYNRQRLERMGIPFGQIELVDNCTICSDNLFSYRRDGISAGRLVATIQLL